MVVGIHACMQQGVVVVSGHRSCRRPWLSPPFCSGSSSSGALSICTYTPMSSSPPSVRPPPVLPPPLQLRSPFIGHLDLQLPFFPAGRYISIALSLVYCKNQGGFIFSTSRSNKKPPLHFSGPSDSQNTRPGGGHEIDGAMAVSSPRRALLAAVLLAFLLGAATGIRTTTTLSSSQNLAEDKSRLGSTPPSCRNRCSACNPCTPVQVTTIPGRSRSRSSARVVADDDATAVVAGYARYTNYKPLGWKCRCAGRLYDP